MEVISRLSMFNSQSVMALRILNLFKTCIFLLIHSISLVLCA